MRLLHEIYGLNVGDCRYRGKLKKKIECAFPNELAFVAAKVNTAEVVICKSVFESTYHCSIDKTTTVDEAALLLRKDILEYSSSLPQQSWPPRVDELEQQNAPHSVKQFFATLLNSGKHSLTESDSKQRLIDSYSADMIHSVTNGAVMTAKHVLLALGLHSITGMKEVVKINHRLGHCISYDKTCEIETALAEASLVRSKQTNILPIIPIGEETVITYFWVDNFDICVESQKGGGSVNTTHMMAFQDSVVEPNNTHHIPIPRNKKRRLSCQPDNDTRILIVDKNQEPPKFSTVKNASPLANEFKSLYFIWLCFRKWNSYDQAIPTFSGWLLQIRARRISNAALIKTRETYLPPITAKVTDFESIRKYMEYLQSLAASVNMPYVNIALDVGAAINAYKFIWNDTNHFGNIVIHLGDFHFIKENFQVNLK